MNSPTDIVVASVIIIVATTMIKNAKHKKNHIAPIIFGFMLLVALLILATFAPTVAKGLGYMGMVGAFVVNGPDVFSLLKNIGAQPAAPPKK
jgi:hypothetical protein